MDNWKIRPAKEEDATAILEIYAPHVENSAVSFEWTVPNEKEISTRILKSFELHVWLVCEFEGSVVGFSYASTFRSRQAYDWVAEVSVYVHQDFKNRGIASALYTSLEKVLSLQGYKQMIAVMTSPNPPSRIFHLAFGFVSAGILHNVGVKFNVWHAIEIFSKNLPSHSSLGSPIRRFSALDLDVVDKIFRESAKSIT